MSINHFNKLEKCLLFALLFSSLYLFFCGNIYHAAAHETSLEESNLTSENSQGDTTNTASEAQSEKNSDRELPESVELEDLRIPDAPALSIMGSPKIEIAKPGTPRALGLTLIESLADSQTNIPQNFALDFAPYWWSQRPLNTLDDEICRPSSQAGKATECEPISYGESLLRSLTISIASSAQDFELEEDIDLTRLGLGLRLSLLTGNINPAFRDRYNLVPGELKCIYKVVDGVEKDFENDLEKEQCLAENIELLREIGRELEQLSSSRVGWQLDFALASALDLPENNFDNAEFTRLGTWLTAAYVPTNSDREASSFTFLGIGRYIYDDFEDEGESIVDLGGRIIWSPKATPLSGSVEYLRRLGDNDGDRLVGLAEYKSNDAYSVFASFGQTFEEDFTGNEDLVTLLGINIGLGQKPKALLPTP